MGCLVLTACQNAATSTETSSTQQEQSANATPGPDGAHALNDADTAAAVERELYADPSVPATGIHVKVTEGVVVLTGKVNNLLATSRAPYLAAAVRGVRGIDNRLDVDVPDVDDASLKNDVVSAMALDPTVEPFDVNIKVHDQVVTLLGTVKSQQERVWAERDAKSVVGVRAVENKLKIKYPEPRTDAEIREDVLGRLHWDALLHDGLLVVSVQNGRVNLSGYVGSLGEKLRAEQEAWATGVKAVSSDQLEVKWWAEDNDLRHGKYVDQTDQEIESAIKEGLSLDPRVSSFTVTPTVDGGVVTLVGTVTSLRAKRTAKEIAENTVGVSRVDNLLDVELNGASDASQQRQALSALSLNPLTKSRDIGVEVRSGIATLTGKVQNAAEKAEAEGVVEGIAGISAVIDKLAIANPIPFAVEYRGGPYYPNVSSWAAYAASLPLKTDLEMERDIRQDLQWSPYVNAKDVHVHVNEGVATLTGKVKTLRARKAAEANAYQGGAVKTVDDIEVAAH